MSDGLRHGTWPVFPCGVPFTHKPTNRLALNLMGLVIILGYRRGREPQNLKLGYGTQFLLSEVHCPTANFYLHINYLFIIFDLSLIMQNKINMQMNLNDLLIASKLRGLLPTATVIIVDMGRIYGHIILHVPHRDYRLVWNNIANIDDMITQELDGDVLELTVRHATNVPVPNEDYDTRFEINFHYEH